MGKRLAIRLGTTQVTVALNESATAQALAAAAPFEATSNRWGDEVYFGTPVDGEPREATAETVTLGTVGYWPPGRALCLFFGPTPLSAAGEIRPASAVALVGEMAAEAGAALADVRDGEPVEVTLLATVDD